MHPYFLGLITEDIKGNLFTNAHLFIISLVNTEGFAVRGEGGVGGWCCVGKGGDGVVRLRMLNLCDPRSV